MESNPGNADEEDGSACLTAKHEFVWLRVAAFLHVNELLGKVALLSMEHLTVLGDDRCWSTLALPPGPRRTHRLLKLMLEEEPEFWKHPLQQVESLELDLHMCTSSTAESLQHLLQRGLAFDGALRSIHLRRIPVRPAVTEEEKRARKSEPRLYTAKDLKLVNPIPQSDSDEPALVFLLKPSILKQLRLLMADFRHFRLRPSQQPCQQDSAATTLELIVARAPAEVDTLPVTSGTKAGKWAASRSARDEAVDLLEAELGELRNLPESIWVEYKRWSMLMLTAYEVLLEENR